MPSNTVEDTLRGHRAERQLGKVASLEIFSNRIVKRPQAPALEFIMARVAEFLHGIVNFTSRESLRVHKVNQKIGGTVAGDLSLLVAFNPIPHVIPMRQLGKRDIIDQIRDVETLKEVLELQWDELMTRKAEHLTKISR